MRYLFGFMFVLALGVMGCSETSGTGGSGGTGIPCDDDWECADDNNACTEDFCDEGFCRYQPVDCDADFNDCTVEMCEPTIGCEQTLVADGTQCAGGICQAGVCELAGTVLPCSEQGIRNAIAAGGDEPYTFDCDGPTTVAGRFGIDNDVILDGGGNITVDDGSFSVDEEVKAELHRFTVGSYFASEKIAYFPPPSGILNNGTLTLTHSTVSNASGTGISNGGTLTMTNCTVSGNTSGGIENGGTLTMTNCTVSANMADQEDGTSGIVNWEDGTLTVANNVVEGDCSNDGVISSNGYNIESPGNTCGFDQEGDQPSVTEMQLNLGELADNGGGTRTHKPGPGSTAIDAIPGDACEVTEDQRGEPRPETDGTMCDVGSVEVQP